MNDRQRELVVRTRAADDLEACTEIVAAVDLTLPDDRVFSEYVYAAPQTEPPR